MGDKAPSTPSWQQQAPSAAGSSSVKPPLQSQPSKTGIPCWLAQAATADSAAQDKAPSIPPWRQQAPSTMGSFSAKPQAQSQRSLPAMAVSRESKPATLQRTHRSVFVRLLD